MPRVELRKWVEKAPGGSASSQAFPRFEPVEHTVASLRDVARFESRDSVYTVDRTYPDMTVIKFDAHMDRLEDSARRERIDLDFNRRRFRRALRGFFDGVGFDLIRFRIAVARSEPTSLYLAAEEFFPPADELIEKGVRCSVLHGAARRNPVAKTADWMLDREQFPLPTWAYEGLLVDEKQRILEGATSNFYAILDGQLLTAGAGVLPGIARQIVLEVAAPQMIVDMRPLQLSDLSRISGCFLTSASRGIIPIVQVDDQVIADGKPSAMAKRLRDDYNRWVQENREPL